MADINIRYSSMKNNCPQLRSEPSDWEYASLPFDHFRNVEIQFGISSDSIFNFKVTFDFIKCNNKLITRIDCYNLEKSCRLFSRIWKITVLMLKQFLYDCLLDEGIDILLSKNEL